MKEWLPYVSAAVGAALYADSARNSAGLCLMVTAVILAMDFWRTKA